MSTRFRKWLSTWYSKHGGEVQFIDPAGEIARFIFDKRALTAAGLPRPKVFEPQFNRELDRLETSICGLNCVSEERLWSLGRSIRAKDGLSAIAAVTLPTAAVEKTGLQCEPAPEPDFEEHGVVIGWDPENKDRRLSMQQSLAAAADLSRVRRPPSP